MSNNRPNSGDRRNYTGEFLDDDVGLKIAHPSPNAEIYMRPRGSFFPSLSFMFVCLLIMAAVGAGAYFYGYQRGVEIGQSNLPPLILAEQEPIKKSPAQVPGGVPPKPEDLNIYEVARGQTESGQGGNPRNNNAANKADGSIESLIESNKLSQLEKNAIEVSPPRPDLNREPSARPSAVRPTARPRPPTAAPTRAATYMVQLAATRSRALARAAYSRMQQSHVTMLSRRDPLILRVDLGSKGIFYRVNVPGFSGNEAASQFCIQLKRRGQDCFVRKQP